MTIFDVFLLLGGLAFFLYGMNAMSDGLEKLAGGKLEKTLKKMTSNKLGSMGLGAGITIDGIINIFTQNLPPVITIICAGVGVAFIFYGQFKYNKGIF